MLCLLGLFFLMHYCFWRCIGCLTGHSFYRRGSCNKSEDDVSAHPDDSQVFSRNRKKPQWVVDKVLYLMAISNSSYGKVGQLFNQLHGDQETVSKTFVYNKVKQHQYEMLRIKREIKRKPPRSIPVNQTWGLDLTTVTVDKQSKLILGVIDHGSRFNLRETLINSPNLR